MIAKHRLEALSDGIYAIALTLLVLELRLPALPHGIDDAGLLAALQALAPKGFAWLLSFWVIALFWLAQQRLYRVCRAIDSSLAWIELAQLSLITLFPFSTALMGEYGGQAPAAVLYASHLLAIALLSWLRNAHLLRHPELHAPELTAQAAQALRVRSWVLVGCTLVTVVLGFFVPPLNMLAMVPMIVLSRFARA